MSGFTQLRAPVYSKKILGPDGKPALLGHFPVVFDRDNSTALTYGVHPGAVARFGEAEVAAAIEALDDEDTLGEYRASYFRDE